MRPLFFALIAVSLYLGYRAHVDANPTPPVAKQGGRVSVHQVPSADCCHIPANRGFTH